MNKAILNSKKMDYCTPQDFFESLNKEFSFTLDAAATSKSAKCKMYYTPETDGLSSPWNIAGGAVFCNPPYGREIKCKQSSKKGQISPQSIPVLGRGFATKYTSGKVS